MAARQCGRGGKRTPGRLSPERPGERRQPTPFRYAMRGGDSRTAELSSKIGIGLMRDRIGHRHSRRYSIALPLRYKLHGASQPPAGIGRTRNLSDRGACLELAEPFPPATRLQLTLETIADGLGLEAGVVWVGETVGPEGGLLHGVNFLNLTPAQEQTLQTLLRLLGEDSQ